MSNLTPDNPSQPNLHFSAATSTSSWPLRFWLINALTGVIAGLAGGLLMRLLHAVEHVAWRYRTGTLLEAISRASASRHILMLLAAGLLVGVGGKLIRKRLGPGGGALFAVEVLLGSISLRLALPALLCSGIATAASWLLLPTGPIYRVPEYHLSLQLTVWSLVAGPILSLATVPLEHFSLRYSVISAVPDEVQSVLGCD